LVVDEFVHGDNSGIEYFVYDDNIDNLILLASVDEAGKKQNHRGSAFGLLGIPCNQALAIRCSEILLRQGLNLPTSSLS
jgi:hypothetical protein